MESLAGYGRSTDYYDDLLRVVAEHDMHSRNDLHHDKQRVDQLDNLVVGDLEDGTHQRENKAYVG